MILSERFTEVKFGLSIESSIREMSSSDSPLPSEKQADRILEAINDDYGGVVVEMTNEPMDAHIFVSLLRASLSHWRQLVLKSLFLLIQVSLIKIFYFSFG